MRKLILLVFMAIFVALPFQAMAYDINDAPNDSIGFPLYETYGINVLNFTPGVNSGNIVLQIFTNFPQGGETVNGTPPWTTFPADVFVTENYFGVDYRWAVPLVSHDGFVPGTFYAVGTSLTSDSQDPSGGSGYIYNHNVPVLLSTVGNNYGFASIGGGSVNWASTGGPNPDWLVTVILGLFEDDPFATMTFDWGTATCANDLITGQAGGGGNPEVPIPPTVLLMGSGLLGLVALRKMKAPKLAA
jgi:hypothetical protein